MTQDFRSALRNIKQSPGFATVVVLTLALGIGANTAIFSVVNGVVIKPLDYHEPDRLVFIQTAFPTTGFDEFWISAPEYLLYRDTSRSFESMGAFNTGEVSLTGGDTPLRVAAGFATASLFTTLGVNAMLGRTFTEAEDSPAGAPVALLSYGLWVRAFGAREGVVGEGIDVDGITRVVVGVMPPQFDLDDRNIDVWTPLAFDEANPPSWGGHNYLGVGRLQRDVTAGQARAELDTLLVRWAEARPDSHTVRPDVHEVIFKPLRARVVGDVEPLLLTLLGAVGFVLLIAVANVGNLLLARAEIRQKEIAVRTALGAGRGRLARQFITESLVLSLVAGAVVLVVGAGLMLRSFSSLLSVSPGFQAQGVLSFRIFLPAASYPDPTDQIGFFDRVRARFEALPGVQSMSLMSGLPPIRRINANTMEFEGIAPTPDGPPSEMDYWQFVMDDYFSTMRIPLVDGRLFSTLDAEGALPVVLVNETAAALYWPDGAVGRRLRPCCGDSQPWLTVVGVVGDVKQGGMDQETGTELYFFVPQLASAFRNVPRTMNVVLRTSVPPESLAGQVRQVVASLDPSLPLADVQTMATAVSRSMARPRFLTLLLGAFGAIALALAAVGIYGVMSVFVAGRSREMGIRIALGAASGSVMALVLGQGLKIAATGLVVGVAGALAVNRLVGSLLFGIGALDAATYAGVLGLLAVVAALACLVPARRATRVDPMVVLK